MSVDDDDDNEPLLDVQRVDLFTFDAASTASPHLAPTDPWPSPAELEPADEAQLAAARRVLFGATRAHSATRSECARRVATDDAAEGVGRLGGARSQRRRRHCAIRRRQSHSVECRRRCRRGAGRRGAAQRGVGAVAARAQARIGSAARIAHSRRCLRSTCGGRWPGPTRRTPPSRSTSAGRWRARRESIRRSRPSTCAPAAR
jgi:hypothetical protein